MPRIPTKQMKDAFEYVEQFAYAERRFGRNGEHYLVHETKLEDRQEIYTYIHYNTQCVRIIYRLNVCECTVRVFPSAFSTTDACNINGLLRCLGITEVQCHKNDYFVYLTKNGDKEKFSTLTFKINRD